MRVRKSGTFGHTQKAEGADALLEDLLLEDLPAPSSYLPAAYLNETFTLAR